MSSKYENARLYVGRKKLKNLIFFPYKLYSCLHGLMAKAFIYSLWISHVKFIVVEPCFVSNQSIFLEIYLLGFVSKLNFYNFSKQRGPLPLDYLLQQSHSTKIDWSHV